MTLRAIGLEKLPCHGDFPHNSSRAFSPYFLPHMLFRILFPQYFLSLSIIFSLPVFSYFSSRLSPYSIFSVSSPSSLSSSLSLSFLLIFILSLPLLFLSLFLYPSFLFSHSFSLFIHPLFFPSLYLIV